MHTDSTEGFDYQNLLKLIYFYLRHAHSIRMPKKVLSQSISIMQFPMILLLILFVLGAQVQCSAKL